MLFDIKEVIFQSGLKIENFKIVLPEWCERVAIDVGLSSNAPQSKIWLSRDPALCVFGFEPIPSNFTQLSAGSSMFQVKIDPDLIGQRIFILQAALGNPSVPREVSMYQTEKDKGCSSILEPIEFKVEEIVKVKEFSLEMFLDYFPWDKIQVINYLKTDCQGYDYNVIAGCGKYLDRFLSITCEVETARYLNPSGTLKDFRILIEPNGFKYLNRLKRFVLRKFRLLSNILVDDPTWIRSSSKIIGRTSPKIYQRG